MSFDKAQDNGFGCLMKVWDWGYCKFWNLWFTLVRLYCLIGLILDNTIKRLHCYGLLALCHVIFWNFFLQFTFHLIKNDSMSWHTFLSFDWKVSWLEILNFEGVKPTVWTKIHLVESVRLSTVVACKTANIHIMLFTSTLKVKNPSLWVKLPD